MFQGELTVLPAPNPSLHLPYSNTPKRKSFMESLVKHRPQYLILGSPNEEWKTRNSDQQSGWGARVRGVVGKVTFVFRFGLVLNEPTSSALLSHTERRNDQ